MERKRHKASQRAQGKRDGKHKAKKKCQSFALEINWSQTIKIELLTAVYFKTKGTRDNAKEARKLQTESDPHEIEGWEDRDNSFEQKKG